MMQYRKRENQLTYQQLDDVVRRAVADIVGPIRQDISILRSANDKTNEKIDRLQSTAVQETRLNDYVLRSVYEAVQKSMEARMVALETDDRDDRKTQETRSLQIMYITITVAIGIVTLLAGAILSHLVFH